LPILLKKSLILYVLELVQLIQILFFQTAVMGSLDSFLDSFFNNWSWGRWLLRYNSMLSKNVIPDIGSEVWSIRSGKKYHSVSALGSSMGTLTGMSIVGMSILKNCVNTLLVLLVERSVLLPGRCQEATVCTVCPKL
jgi:hypothetical protein